MGLHLENVNWIGLADFGVWLAALGAISWWLIKRTSVLLGLCFLYLGFSGLFIFGGSFNFINFDPMARIYQFSAICAFGWLMVLGAFAFVFPVETWKIIFRWTALLNACLIALGVLVHQKGIEIFGPWGLLLNGSMSGCFAACTYPLFEEDDWRGRWITIIAVMLAGRSLPIAVLSVMIATMFLLRRRWQLLLPLVPLSIGAGYLLKGHLLLNDNGRVGVWKSGFHYFWDHVSHLFGAGLGTFLVVGPSLTEGAMIWMHSDWLQVGFELGALGLLLVLGVYGEALWRSRGRVQLLTALVGYGAFAVANMPLRYPVAALYGAFLLRWAFESKMESHGKEAQKN